MRGMGQKRQKEEFRRGKRRIEAWDIKGFEMEGVTTPVRVAAYAEHEEKKDGREEIHWMWAATTSEEIDYRIIWKIMHKRWDIEENAFHQLKTYDHAKRCYDHKGKEAIFILMIMAFNIRELYLYRRMRGFRKSGITRVSATKKLRDDLLLENLRGCLLCKGWIAGENRVAERSLKDEFNRGIDFLRLKIGKKTYANKQGG